MRTPHLHLCSPSASSAEPSKSITQHRLGVADHHLLFSLKLFFYRLTFNRDLRLPLKSLRLCLCRVIRRGSYAYYNSYELIHATTCHLICRRFKRSYHIFILFLFFSHFYFSASGQAVVTGRCRPFFPPVFAFNFYRA